MIDPSIENEKVKKVMSGLRPKRPSQKTIQLNQNKTPEDKKVVALNLFDRFCSHFLPWTLKSSTNPIGDTPLPNIFVDVNQYIELWRSLLIEETKESILNSLSNTRHFQSAKVKLHVTQSINFDRNDMKQIKIECSHIPIIDLSNLSSIQSNHNNSWEIPGPTDLVIISSEPLPEPFTRQRLDNLVWVLGLVLLYKDPNFSSNMKDRNNRDNPSIFHIKVDRDLYTRLCLTTSTQVKASSSSSTQTIIEENGYKVTQNSNNNNNSSNNNSSSSTTKNNRLFHESENKTQNSSFALEKQDLFAYCTVIDSLSSYWREFFALHDLSTSIPLVREILACDPRPIEMPFTPPSDTQTVESLAIDTTVLNSVKNLIKYPGMTESLIKIMEKKCNSSQMHALSTVLKQSNGFTLIQGPPGTGKTSTIINILNCLHLREYNKFYASMLSSVLGAEGIHCRVKGPTDPTPWIALVSKIAVAKPHILVATPSNVAVDSIVERILADKFTDSGGKKYKPNILRFGAGRSSGVKSVSLEEAVEEEHMNTSNDRDRKAMISKLASDIEKLVQEIYALQSYLINLRTAFTTYPLPRGYELRVDMNTGLPYWVDHHTRTVTKTSPTAANILPSNTLLANFIGTPSVSMSAEKEAEGQKLLSTRGLSELTLDSLPEYKLHSQKITKLLESLYRCHMKRSRCLARSKPHEHGGLVAVRHTVEMSLVDTSEIFFTTLNSAGHPSLENTNFVVCVVDEAAQCTEPSLLIPLRKGCKQCFLVGDPYQLPATVFSDRVRKVGYDKSLFERLLDTGYPKILLNTQYRMHPQISSFPNQSFYAGKIRDGDNVKGSDYCPSYISNIYSCAASNRDGLETSHSMDYIESKIEDSHDDSPVPLLKPFLFFDLISSRDHHDEETLSKSNTEEARLCISLIQLLKEQSEIFRVSLGSIGIITPYMEQVNEIRRAMALVGISTSAQYDKRNKGQECEKRKDKDKDKTKDTEGVHVKLEEGKTTSSSSTDKVNNGGNSLEFLDVELNTVDGFQGKEKDLIIISCVRANDTNSVGFLSDFRRMNVALTRGKYGLFVIGHGGTLGGNKLWRELMFYADRNKAYITVEEPTLNCLRSVLISNIQNNQDILSIPTPPMTSDDSHHEGEGYYKKPRFSSLDEDSSNPQRKEEIVSLIVSNEFYSFNEGRSTSNMVELNPTMLFSNLSSFDNESDRVEYEMKPTGKRTYFEYNLELEEGEEKE